MRNNAALDQALTHCIGNGLTFAAFRTPAQAVEIWAQRDPALETVDGDLLWELNEVFVLLPFRVDRQRIPYIRSDVELYFGEIDPDVDLLHDCQGSLQRSGTGSGSTSKADHLKIVEKAHHAIRGGRLEKVVVARVLREELERSALKELFLGICAEHPDAFAALVHDPEHGFWCGISPERLVDEEDDRVSIDALAATRVAGDHPTDQGLWNEKERHEQAVVRDHILRVLSDLRSIDVQQAAIDVVRAGRLEHLRTRITADLAGRTLSDLVLALHPTPAVCGLPAQEALRFILENEVHDRGLYAGAWGPWNPDGRTQLFVNIRCLQQRGGKAWLHAGSGITAGSDPEAEWQETEAKLRTLLAPIEALRRSR